MSALRSILAGNLHSAPTLRPQTCPGAPKRRALCSSWKNIWHHSRTLLTQELQNASAVLTSGRNFAQRLHFEAASCFLLIFLRFLVQLLLLKCERCAKFLPKSWNKGNKSWIVLLGILILLLEGNKISGFCCWKATNVGNLVAGRQQKTDNDKNEPKRTDSNGFQRISTKIGSLGGITGREPVTVFRSHSLVTPAEGGRRIVSSFQYFFKK